MNKSHGKSLSELEQLMFADLDRSGLRKFAKQLRVRPLTAEQLRGKCPELKLVAGGYLLPYFDMDGKPNEFFRFRYLEEPLRTGFAALTSRKKPPRYVQSAGAPPRAYFAPFASWTELQKDVNKRLFITEGEKKAACAVSLGIPAIGLGGVWNYKSADDSFLSDLEQFDWKQRPVYIVFDSDINTNHHVMLAATRLARQLLQRGALVFILRLHSPFEEKIGLDDFLVAEGKEGFNRLIEEEAEEFAASRELHKLNERVIYVHNHSIFEVSTGQRITPANFVNSVYSDLNYVEKVTVTKNGQDFVKPVIKRTAREWLLWPGRAKVPAYVYEPGKPRILPEGVNDWEGWGVPEEFVRKGDTSLWERLLDFQFGDNRQWFEKWLAYPIQNPGIKLPTAVLNWGRYHGTGKDLIAGTMRLIYGQNFIKLKESDVDATHNELFEHKQFIAFEELSGGVNNRRIVGDRFKTLLTQTHVNINPKFLRPYSIRDCINYYVTSNHADPLYIEPEDRRWFVNQVVGKPIEGDFYQRYLAHFGLPPFGPVKAESAGALFYRLLHLDTADFDPTAHAPMTAAKRALISISQSDPAAWAATLRDEPDAVLQYNHNPIQVSLMLENELLMLFKLKFPDSTRPFMQKVLAEAGITKANRGEQVRNCGSWGAPHLYIVRDREELEARKEKALSERFLRERKKALCPFNEPFQKERKF